MKNQKITVLSGDCVYRLRYMLLKSKNGFNIHIQSDKYDKKTYLLDKNAPRLCTETNFVALSITTTTETAEDLFNEIVDNLVFPVSLDYMVEDVKLRSSKGSNYRIRINQNKIPAQQ